MFVIQKQLVCTHRVARRPADAADLEAGQARDRRDDARERGPRGEREECDTSCTDEHYGPQEPSMAVSARLCWDRVGLLLDGLGRVQGPHRDD